MAKFPNAATDEPAALPRSVCQKHDVLGNAASLISYFNVVPRTKTIVGTMVQNDAYSITDSGLTKGFRNVRQYGIILSRDEAFLVGLLA